MLFTFAGSTHSKYVTYLLETICTIELESSPALRNCILQSMLASLSGRAGSFSAMDFIQEYFNRLLEAIVERKGAEYGATFIRNVISRNLHHFARIKLDLRDSVGLGKRSGRHSAPHMKPEVKKLMDTYWKLELHRRRAGRTYSDRDVDDFRRGMIKLQSGKLKKWVEHTTRTRGLTLKGFPIALDELILDEEEGEGEEHPQESSEPITLGTMQLVDGEFVFARLNVDEEDDLLAEFEKECVVSDEETETDINNDCE
jgi:hypothetical protein